MDQFWGARSRVANIIMLGAVMKITGMLKTDSVVEALTDTLGKKKPALLEINIIALSKGVEAAMKESDK